MSANPSTSFPSICRLLLAGAVALGLAPLGASVAEAQSSIIPIGMSAPIYAGTPGAPAVPREARFGLARTMLAQPHLTPLGKPCLTINPFSRPQIRNRDIYDHSLLIRNECSQKIRFLACYYHAGNCSTLSIQGYARQEKLFGIFPEKEFRIEYREYLD
jgi:hypothetical protein